MNEIRPEASATDLNKTGMRIWIMADRMCRALYGYGFDEYVRRMEESPDIEDDKEDA